MSCVSLIDTTGYIRLEYPYQDPQQKQKNSHRSLRVISESTLTIIQLQKVSPHAILQATKESLIYAYSTSQALKRLWFW